jgi:hypothetical protein
VIEYCIHIANVLYLVSFLTRDMLWLRILTCCGLLLGVVFFSCQPAPMYGPTVWHVVFLLINGIQIRRLIQDRRRLKLSKEREEVAEQAFQGLTRNEVLNLLTHAMCAQEDHLPDFHQAARHPLSDDEQVVRDIAFRALSRNEIVNLLIRRLWQSLRWVNPSTWRVIRNASNEPTPVGGQWRQLARTAKDD